MKKKYKIAVIAIIAAIALLCSCAETADNVIVLKPSAETKKYKEQLYEAVEEESGKIYYAEPYFSEKEIKTENRLETLDFAGSDVYTVESEAYDCIVLYINGGFSSGVSERHIKFCDRLATALNAKVYIPDYPPAHKSAYREAYQLIEELYESLASPDMPLYMFGDSVGGSIAIGITQKLMQEGKRLPKKLALISPLADMSLSNPEISKYQKKDRITNRETLRKSAEAWADGEDLSSAMLSPVNVSYPGFPPVLIFAATEDILYPDTMLLFDELNYIGVKTLLVEGRGFWNDFPLCDIKEQSDCIEILKNFITD